MNFACFTLKDFLPNNFFFTLFHSCHFYINWAELLGLVENFREFNVDYDVRKKCSHWFQFWTICWLFIKIFQNLRFLQCFGVKINHYCTTKVKSFSIFNKTSLIPHDQHCRTAVVEKKKHFCYLTSFFPWKKTIFGRNQLIFVIKFRANMSTLGL